MTRSAGGGVSPVIRGQTLCYTGSSDRPLFSSQDACQINDPGSRSVIQGLTLDYTGIAAGMFFFLYGVFRFMVEFVREPDASYLIPGLTRGMTYSLPMVFIGIAIIYWAYKRPPAAPKHMPEAQKPAKEK